ncbi:MAG: hypothetical protein DRP57_01695 [Spirochaetes bacterium]|nr:MAG: hypothetical protein DRP57_01695 [Spirochaetota bacterium]
MFVAKFIGRIYSIPASVIDVLPNGAKKEILREKRTVENVLKKVKIGDKVDALIRPEFIHLDKDFNKYKVTGTIKERTFLGEKVEYIVSIDGIDVMVSSSDPGEHMQFSGLY